MLSTAYLIEEGWKTNPIVHYPSLSSPLHNYGQTLTLHAYSVPFRQAIARHGFEGAADMLDEPEWGVDPEQMQSSSIDLCKPKLITVRLTPEGKQRLAADYKLLTFITSEMIQSL